MATAAVQSDPPLIVRGQLAIRTIPGRNGRFGSDAEAEAVVRVVTTAGAGAEA